MNPRVISVNPFSEMLARKHWQADHGLAPNVTSWGTEHVVREFRRVYGHGMGDRRCCCPLPCSVCTGPPLTLGVSFSNVAVYSPSSCQDCLSWNTAHTLYQTSDDGCCWGQYYHGWPYADMPCGSPANGLPCYGHFCCCASLCSQAPGFISSTSVQVYGGDKDFGSCIVFSKCFVDQGYVPCVGMGVIPRYSYKTCGSGCDWSGCTECTLL